jgi:hypothetical protein
MHKNTIISLIDSCDKMLAGPGLVIVFRVFPKRQYDAVGNLAAALPQRFAFNRHPPLRVVQTQTCRLIRCNQKVLVLRDCVDTENRASRIRD